MAYNRINYLKKIRDIQEIVLRYQRKDGSTLIWIYENHIKPIYHISYSTFSNYLSIPAQRELNKIEDNEGDIKKPLV